MSLKSVIALVVLFSFGCATAPDGVRKGIVVGLHAITATASVMDVVDQQKTAAAIAKAKGGDIAGATADLDKWEAQSQKIAQSLQVLWDAMKTAADIVTAYEKGSGPKPDYSALQVKIIEAVTDLAKALSDAGVKVAGI